MMQRHWLLMTVLISVLILMGSCYNYSAPPGESSPMEPFSPGEPQVFFNADRTGIQPGECVNLEWRVEGGDFFGVELDGQPVDPFGHRQVCPPETAVYTLSVDIGEAMLHREVVVNVGGTGQQPSQPQTPGQPPAPGCPGAPMFTHFEANPGFITSGQSTSLEWGPITNGATGELVGSVMLTPGNFGEVGSPGSRQVSPTSTTTYTLTATGCGGTATKTVTVVVAVVGTPMPIPPPAPPGGGGWSGPPKVTNVVVHATPYTGPCPKTLVWTADITVDGPCTVTYQWERHDGAIGQVETLNFSAAGTKTVQDTWMVWVGNNATYWERVRILTPLPMLSNQANLTFTCTP
ncbi:MAG: hypothetical protein JSV54_05445 [Chloroflexota bacterium]|nr:MAG: hypothetical protein JSV54_05445 [Chloroflexota bacterium]